MSRHPIETITSPNNPIIKQIKSLHQKKYRDQHGQYIIEGIKMVREALLMRLSVQKVIILEDNMHELSDLICLSTDIHMPCIATTDRLFKDLSDTQAPQGVLAVVEQSLVTADSVLNREQSFIVVLDGVKDPGNMGTIIRTVDAAGGDGVLLLNDCVDPYNPKVVRATMGSILRIPIIRLPHAVDAMNDLKDRGYHIVCTHLQGTDAFKWPGGYMKTALVIGSESHGVSDVVAKVSSSLVRIPMVGGAESLNASVAAGILIYEIFRKGMKVDE